MTLLRAVGSYSECFGSDLVSACCDPHVAVYRVFSYERLAKGCVGHLGFGVLDYGFQNRSEPNQYFSTWSKNQVDHKPIQNKTCFKQSKDSVKKRLAKRQVFCIDQYQLSIFRVDPNTNAPKLSFKNISKSHTLYDNLRDNCTQKNNSKFVILPSVITFEVHLKLNEMDPQKNKMNSLAVHRQPIQSGRLAQPISIRTCSTLYKNELVCQYHKSPFCRNSFPSLHER